MKAHVSAILAAATLAVSAVAMAAPAHADPRQDSRQYYAYNQPRPDYRGDYRGERRDSFNREDLMRMEARIDRGFRSGRLTRHEARYLSGELGELRQRARYYWQTGGMSWRERQDLDARYHRLQERIRYQMHDDDYRGDWNNRGPGRY